MFHRIISDPEILSGKPTIRGTRISVEMILEWVALGATRDEILKRHPHLTAEDVEQALGYAATAVRLGRRWPERESAARPLAATKGVLAADQHG